MSDEKENQKDEPEKASEGSEKPAAEPEKAAAPVAEKPAENAEKAAEPPQASAAKAAGPKPPRTKKEKILVGCVAAAAIGLVVAVMYFFTVLSQAKNPLAQTPAGRAPSEAELERDEAQFAPKTNVSIPQDSSVLHEKPAAPAKKGPTNSAKAKSGK